MSGCQSAVQASMAAVSKWSKDRRTTSTLASRLPLPTRPDQPEPGDHHGLGLREAPAGLAEQDRDLVAAALVEAPLLLAPRLHGGRAGALGQDHRLVDGGERQDRDADDLHGGAAH